MSIIQTASEAAEEAIITYLKECGLDERQCGNVHRQLAALKTHISEETQSQAQPGMFESQLTQSFG